MYSVDNAAQHQTVQHKTTIINIQPTTSYAPADYSGYAFDPNPAYSDTNSTLVAYSNLPTCP